MLNSPLVTKLIQLAIDEDLPFGDVTSEICIPDIAQSSAQLVAKEKMKICGLPLISRVFEQIGANVAVKLHNKDGDWVKAGSKVASLTGRTRDLLSAERIILNLIQRLSGVATLTDQVVKAAGGLNILDTRKTTPGLRILEKYAVRVGGGSNHRSNLSEMILVKNNHIDGFQKFQKAGKGDGLAALLQKIKKEKPFHLSWEIEVRNLQELSAALDAGAPVVMLDNFADKDIARALKLIEIRQSRPLVEISGGVDLKRLKSLKKYRGLAVSMGMLTREARMLDLSLNIA